MTGNRWERKWDQRIERARELAAAHPFAAEGLRFYERLTGFQKSLYAGFVRPSGSLHNELDLDGLLPHLPSFLSLIEAIAPPPRAQISERLPPSPCCLRTPTCGRLEQSGQSAGVVSWVCAGPVWSARCSA